MNDEAKSRVALIEQPSAHSIVRANQHKGLLLANPHAGHSGLLNAAAGIQQPTTGIAELLSQSLLAATTQLREIPYPLAAPIPQDQFAQVAALIMSQQEQAGGNTIGIGSLAAFGSNPASASLPAVASSAAAAASSSTSAERNDDGCQARLRSTIRMKKAMAQTQREKEWIRHYKELVNFREVRPSSRLMNCTSTIPLTGRMPHLLLTNTQIYGHCRVPHGYKSNLPLSWWVLNMRAQY